MPDARTFSDTKDMLMAGRFLCCLLLPLSCLTASVAVAAEGSADLDALQEQAMKAAVLKVAPCVVQVETSGGTDVLQGGAIRKGVGPTTGLIIAPDGYIISSAFNFANKPSAIFVQVPGSPTRYVAKAVATDQTRMLTLLKIDATGLPVPTAAPKKDFRVGQWCVALGRGWAGTDSPPSVSVGIISALNRIWGKALQTDAKISPINYGGPLVDIYGRVQGVLVPASPRGDDETAGFEWYDSGIGFAIPLEDVDAVLPRLRQGHDLKRGLLGVLLKGQDIYAAKAEIGSVAPGSAAAKAGLRAGDVIVKIDGVAIDRQARMMHVLGNKYEGDQVSVSVKRGGKEIDFPKIKLAGLLSAFAPPFLGILPVRDDPELGVEIRYVYPQSPAAAAGVKPGDRIMSIGLSNTPMRAFSGRDEFTALLNLIVPGTEVKLQVRRKGAKTTSDLSVRLGEGPDTVPAELPEPASRKLALATRKEAPVPPGGQRRPPAPPKQPESKPSGKDVETGFLKRTNASGDRAYWLYVPENYDPNIAHAVLVWLHPARKGTDKDAKEFVSLWQDYCNEQHMILIGPRAQNETGWLFSEADSVRDTIREVMSLYTCDAQRVVVHGMGSGGNLAFYLGFRARDLVRGVAVTGAVLSGQAADSVPAQRLAFYLVAGARDPLAGAIAQTRVKLADKKFSVVYRVMADKGHEYLDADPGLISELARWIDSLDRE